jgi:NAD(P)H-dependent flavin oxidoreductase YrpB (nitropropane dioxygenase family)
MKALETEFCRQFGVRYPIVQTGMGWVSGARLTAATAEAGGLGFLAAATMTVPELAQAIRKVKERTAHPFGVNLRGDAANAAEVIALLVEQGVPIASFAGAPTKEAVKRLKGAGIKTVVTVGMRRHAEKMAEWGVDGLIAQGHEGGGHTGPVPTTLLLPEVCRAVNIPVLGAGGFKDGRGLVAALSFGAAGIAMGTRFLLTRESHVPDSVKDTYLKTDVRGTVVTNAVDGHPQRVIQTTFITSLERANPVAALWRAVGQALRFKDLTGATLLGLWHEARTMRKTQELPWAQLALAANAPMLTRASMVDGRMEAGILPTGQVVGVIDSLPTVAEVIESVMAEARETLLRLGVQS